MIAVQKIAMIISPAFTFFNNEVNAIIKGYIIINYYEIGIMVVIK